MDDYATQFDSAQQAQVLADLKADIDAREWGFFAVVNFVVDKDAPYAVGPSACCLPAALT